MRRRISNAARCELDEQISRLAELLDEAEALAGVGPGSISIAEGRPRRAKPPATAQPLPGTLPVTLRFADAPRPDLPRPACDRRSREDGEIISVLAAGGPADQHVPTLTLLATPDDLDTDIPAVEGEPLSAGDGLAHWAATELLPATVPAAPCPPPRTPANSTSLDVVAVAAAAEPSGPDAPCPPRRAAACEVVLSDGQPRSVNELRPLAEEHESRGRHAADQGMGELASHASSVRAKSGTQWTAEPPPAAAAHSTLPEFAGPVAPTRLPAETIAPSDTTEPPRTPGLAPTRRGSQAKHDARAHSRHETQPATPAPATSAGLVHSFASRARLMASPAIDTTRRAPESAMDAVSVPVVAAAPAQVPDQAFDTPSAAGAESAEPATTPIATAGEATQPADMGFALSSRDAEPVVIVEADDPPVAASGAVHSAAAAPAALDSTDRPDTQVTRHPLNDHESPRSEEPTSRSGCAADREPRPAGDLALEPALGAAGHGATVVVGTRTRRRRRLRYDNPRPESTAAATPPAAAAPAPPAAPRTATLSPTIRDLLGVCGILLTLGFLCLVVAELLH
jgi:hypothetical protein